MNQVKSLRALGAICALVSAGVSIAADRISTRLREVEIEQKVDAAVSKRLDKEEK